MPRPPPAVGAYYRIVGVLARYLSPLIARSIVDRALADRGISAARLVSADVPSVIEGARAGLGIFCDPGHLTALMLDLAELCDAETAKRSPAGREAPAGAAATSSSAATSSAPRSSGATSSAPGSSPPTRSAATPPAVSRGNRPGDAAPALSPRIIPRSR